MTVSKGWCLAGSWPSCISRSGSTSFQPSLKLISKHRQGSKVIKKYDQAKTPYQRVLASETVSATAKQALPEQYSSLDPVVLLQRIE